MLTYSFRHLAENPGLRRQLIEQLEIIPDAIEELLRFYSMASGAGVVTKDTELSGVPTKAGDRMPYRTAAAGRDSEQFPGTDTFVPDPTTNRHLAFVAGPHLARL